MVLGTLGRVFIEKPAEFLIYRPLGGIYDIIGKAKDGIIDIFGRGKNKLLGVGDFIIDGSKSVVTTAIKKARDITQKTPKWIRDATKWSAIALKDSAQYVSEKAVSFGKGGIQLTRDLAGSARSLGVNAAHLVRDGARSAREGISNRVGSLHGRFDNLRPGQFSLSPRKAFSNAIHDVLRATDRIRTTISNTAQETAALLLEPKLQLVPSRR